MQSFSLWTLGYSEYRCDFEEKVLDQNSPTWEVLPCSTVSEMVLSEDLDRAVSLLTRRLMCCQASIPCQFESRSLTFIFLRSHLSYQLGPNLVNQWKLWRSSDLFFSGIDKPVLQDPQLRRRVWLTECCEISKGDKRGKKAKNHSPLCCKSERNQPQTIVLSLETQINFRWVHGK